MAARVTWILLLLASLIAGFVTYTTVLLTCGDDGPADYGESGAIAFCSWARGGTLDLLAYSGFVPFAILLFGAALWRDPPALRWFNGGVFVLGGVLLITVTLLATAYAVAFLIAVAWILAAIMASVMVEGNGAAQSE